MLASIIIPVYGQTDMTLRCLEALAASRESSSLLHGASRGENQAVPEVLLINNGAQDFPAEGKRLARHLAEYFGSAGRMFSPPRNLNFAGACNLGAREAQGRYICFLNNDTLPAPSWLPPLLNALEQDDSLLMASPLLLYPPRGLPDDARVSPQWRRDGEIQHIGVTLRPDMRVRHLYEYWPADHPVTRRARRFDIVTAASLVMRRADFLEAGAFDEEFRNGFEDVELCSRLVRHTLERGKERRRAAFVPESVVWHFCGSTPGRKTHEEHNRHILAVRKASSCMVPDEHLHLLEDGYELRLTPWLTWQPALSLRQEALLDRELKKQPSPAEVAALLREYPLWLKGRLWLVSHAENPRLALELAMRALHFDTSPAPLEHIFRLAGELGLAELRRSAADSLRAALLPPRERNERLLRLRAELRGRCPELADQPDIVRADEARFLAREEAPLRALLGE